jgi:hypothetical protein
MLTFFIAKNITSKDYFKTITTDRIFFKRYLSLSLDWQYGSVKQISGLILVRAGGLCSTSGDFSRWLTEPDWLNWWRETAHSK